LTRERDLLGVCVKKTWELRTGRNLTSKCGKRKIKGPNSKCLRRENPLKREETRRLPERHGKKETRL